MPTAIGIVPHTGWAWVVRVEGPPDGPRVSVRARVTAIPVLEAELYHRARDHDGDRHAFFAGERIAALARTVAEVRGVTGDASAAVVIGKRPALPALERIVASHALIHTAEGELWRALFAEACVACGLDVRRVDSVGPPDSDGERWLTEQGRALGPPWGKETRAAAVAARAIIA